jgi:BlaI family transcriptional regulator, penicillinase repressor
MLTNDSEASTLVDNMLDVSTWISFWDAKGYNMKESLSRQEWVMMETLWQGNPMFLSDIMEAMEKSVDWNRSSYLTYLKRMADKGLIGYETIRGSRRYYPLVNREDCIENESNYILSKLTEDSTRLLLASMIQKSGLSDKDRDELQVLIKTLGGDSEKEK